jgi:hypothetical protein
MEDTQWAAASVDTPPSAAPVAGTFFKIGLCSPSRRMPPPPSRPVARAPAAWGPRSQPRPPFSPIVLHGDTRTRCRARPMSGSGRPAQGARGQALRRGLAATDGALRPLGPRCEARRGLQASPCIPRSEVSPKGRWAGQTGSRALVSRATQGQSSQPLGRRTSPGVWFYRRHHNL